MKKKQLIISLSLAITVLFSILFQSIHSYEHLAKQLSQKQCHHKYNVTKTDITHQHHNFDHCFVCEFTLASFISPKNISFQISESHKEIPYIFTSIQAFFPYSGSLYSLRGPPITIVFNQS